MKKQRTNFLWRGQASNCAPLASNKLSLPLHYIQICVFSLHSTLLYLVLPLPNCSHSRSSPGRPLHAMAPADRSRPPASRVMTPTGRNLPHNAAAAPWPQPPTQRSGYAMATPRPRSGVQGCRRSQMAVPSHSQTTATLEIKGKK
jgi:hypothetical protein